MDLELATLARAVGGRLDGPADLRIHALAAIEDAGEGECTFLGHDRYLPHLKTTAASAVILRDGVDCPLPSIRVEDPYVAFLKGLELFAPPLEELFPPGVHATAVVGASARLGEGVHVGPHAVVGEGCSIGPGSIVGAGSVLMSDVQVAENCVIYPNVTIRERCELHQGVRVHSGAVIGSDGFGYARTEEGVHKIPQIGVVVLEEGVEIGANVCIDRATTGRTVVQAHAKVDNLVQIGHNVRIGPRSAISAQSGISGSCSLGADVILGGQVGLADHVDIGDRVRLGAKSGVSNDIPEGEIYSGYPAREHRQWRRLHAHYGRLERYASELKELRRRLQELERQQSGSSAEDA